MFDRNCKGCAKQLSPDHVGVMCTLCASGLIPAGPVQRLPHALEVRADGAMRCPSCVGALSFRDISQRFCSACGSVVALEAGRYMAATQRPRTAHLQLAPQPRVDNRWPDEAPIR